MTTQHDERADFESHWYDKYHSGSIKARSDGSYIGNDVQKAWEAWQARAALLAADSRAGYTHADVLQAHTAGYKLGLRQVDRAAQPEPQAVAHWRPIETAPKDGTVILVTDTFTYRSDPEKKPHHVYRAVRWNEEGYGWEIYNDGEIIDQDGPTFWMPLPAEPGSMLSAYPAAPAEREPLTDEQIFKAFIAEPMAGYAALLQQSGEITLCDFRAAVVRIARRIEAAHHIGKPAPVGQLEDCHGLVAGKETS